MDSSERTIIELNIRHYRSRLTTETDPAKRRTIATLLAEEEAKLTDLAKNLEKNRHESRDRKGTSGAG